MINDQKNNTLDETIKQSLSDYEAPFDANDWEKMESVLDAAPKSSTFKWSYVIGTCITLAVLSGGYLIYNNWDSFKTNTSTTTQPIENTTPAVTTAPPVIEPVVPKPQPVIEIKVETPAVVDEPSDKAKEKEELTKEERSKEEVALTEKEKRKKSTGRSQKRKGKRKQQK